MAIKVLALASGVTGLADHRVLNGAMMTSAGQLAVRGGVLPGATSGDLSTVSAMVARIAPVKVLIPNGVSSALGPYLLVSDANVDITFDAGEASVGRVDRIIARAYDNTNDGSGSTTGSIYYLKGQASGSATALPTNSVLLYEMTVPAGASSGSGGLTFSNAVDQRVYTVAQGGIFPVKNNTDMSAITSPYEGMAIYRTDLDVVYIYDGTTWRARGIANVASSANLTSINNPYDGQVAVTRDNDAIYVYNGTTWTVPRLFTKPIGRLVDTTGGQSLPHNTLTAITFASEAIDTDNFHSTSSNTARVTPTKAGYYRFNGSVSFTGRTDYTALEVTLHKAGVAVEPASRIPGSGGSNSTAVVPVQAIISMNGTTDYVDMRARHSNSAAASSTTVLSSQFASVLEWEYLGPTSY